MESWTNDNIIFLLRLTQLIIEYLLHVQNYLLQSNAHKDTQLAATQQSCAQLTARLSEAGSTTKQLKRELRHVKSLMSVYANSAQSSGATAAAVASAVSQALLSQPHVSKAQGMGGRKGLAASALLCSHSVCKLTCPQPCPHCNVQFKSEAFLRSHLARRHPQLSQTIPPASSGSAPSKGAGNQEVKKPEAAEAAGSGSGSGGVSLFPAGNESNQKQLREAGMCESNVR